MANAWQALRNSGDKFWDALKGVGKAADPRRAGGALELLGRAGARSVSLVMDFSSFVMRKAPTLVLIAGVYAAYKAVTHYMKSRPSEGVPTGEFNDQIRNPTLQDEYNKGQQMAFEELGVRQGINYRADNAARVQQRRGGAAVETGAPIAQREQARAAAASTQQNGI